MKHLSIFFCFALAGGCHGDAREQAVIFPDNLCPESVDNLVEYVDPDLERPVAQRVKSIVVEHLGVVEATVTAESNYSNDLGADDLDRVELVMAFEEEFGVELPDDVAEYVLCTVGGSAEYLEYVAQSDDQNNRLYRNFILE